MHERRVRIESVGRLPAGQEALRRNVEMVRIAAEDCLQHSSYDRSQIGLLVHTGVYRAEYLSEPALAALIAGALEINDSVDSLRARRTLAFDVFNGSLGFLNACHVAATMIQAGNVDTAMVVAAEIENNADILPDRLVGVRETASAVVLDVAPREQTGFGRFLFRSFTEHLDRYVVEARHQAGRPYLELRRSPDLDDRYASCLAKVAEELLARDGIKRSEVDIVLPPQRSSVFVQRLSRAINLPLERCVDVSTDGLDLYTSSLPYAFQRVSEQGLARQGDIGLVLDVGAGIQVGAAIYRF